MSMPMHIGTRRVSRYWLWVFCLTLWLSGCVAAPAPVPAERPAPAEGPVQVLTTSNIVADWVRQVGGERVDVYALLPVGNDPHTYHPGTRDVTRVAEADLIFSIGLSLEAAWLDDLVRQASEHAPIVALGDFVDPLPTEHWDEEEHEEHGDHEAHEEHEEQGDHEAHEEHEEHDEQGDHEAHEEHEDHEGHEGHVHGEFDPHFWFDPLRVQTAVEVIAERLAERDPEGTETFARNADAYRQQLDELHAWIQTQTAALPAERKRLVTNHDSLRYFAALYGFEVIGAVIPDISTEREPTAQELARLVDALAAAPVPAIFTDVGVSARLAQRVAEETDMALARLYTGSLGLADSPAATYIDMVRYNVAAIVEALNPQ